ncbi:MAG: hypothetical protein ABR592_02760 [Nitriliruptorales bacterium]
MATATSTAVGDVVAGVAARPARPRVSLSLRRLLLLYLVIPLALGLVVVDQLVLDGSLRAALPREPSHYLLFELVFGWPHIVASTIILATNGEYVAAYRRRLLVASAVITAFFTIGYFTLPYTVLFFVGATATIVHVLKQQIGIGRGAARTGSRIYGAWGWAAIATGVVLYNALFLQALDPYRPVLVPVAAILAAITVWLAVRVHRDITSDLGHRFLWANTALVASSFLFYLGGYGLLAIAVPRVVHDMTAFAFYVVHDANKHGSGPRNSLHRLAARIPGGVFWVTPALAIVVAYLLSEHGDALVHLLSGGIVADAVPKPVSLGVLGYLGMMHYYYESFTWKSGSPYRPYISMRA